MLVENGEDDENLQSYDETARLNLDHVHWMSLGWTAWAQHQQRAFVNNNDFFG